MIKKCIQYSALFLTCTGAVFLSACGSIPQTTYKDISTNPDSFLKGIATAEKESAPSASFIIRSIIVPHQQTATSLIAAGVHLLKNQPFKHIILLSPDFSGQCPTAICVTNSLYETPFGKVAAEPSTVRTLLQSPLTTLKPDLFKENDGIHIVTSYMAHFFLGKTVTPILLSNKWKNSSGALLEAIKSVHNNDTIIMVSSNFSQGFSLGKANMMDELTAETLFAKDLQGIAHLKNPDQSDCLQCLWVLASIAKEKDFYNPSTIHHTNAALLLNKKSIQKTTGYLTMAWYQNAQLSGKSLAVGGDITMTRVKKTPKLSPAMQKAWSGSGIRLVNLEGPLLEKCPPDRLMFNFCNQLDLWQDMKALATHWGIMNNHMMDQYMAGLEETRRLIKEQKEVAVGDHMVDAGDYRFIALTALMNPVIDTPLFDIPYQYKQVLQELHNKKPGTLTVVFVHEGREYRALTSDTENAYLRTFIDAGADVVVATHTHVVSDMEIYKEKPIFRGIGNFIFDQQDEVMTSTGKIVRLRLKDESIQFESFIERI